MKQVEPCELLEGRTLLSTVSPAVAAQLRSAIQLAATQLNTTASVDLNNNPADYIDYTKSNGSWDVTNAGSWSAGAWPAELWEMYELSGNATWKSMAQSWSADLVGEDTQTSDDYLRIFDPFIYAYQDSGDAQAKSAIIAAAEARVTNFDPAVGAWSEPWRASSSGNPAANFGMLLDQTMDSQEVFWAAAQTGNTTLYNDAVTEMTTAEKYLVRSDGSTAQFAYFNSTTGQFIDNETYAGYSASSTWSRGQAWAINSFTNAYEQTHRADFLATAESLANYYISHVPTDGVPYWDYDDPAIPNANRDTSAAAIAATGLLQLAQVDPNAANAAKYFDEGQSILSSLCSNYLASGSSSHGILLQGDDLNFGVNDASLVWGDFYFLKAADLYLNQSSGGSVMGSVSGGSAGETVYLDANNNGVLDAGELSTAVGAGGTYTFTDVPAGAYIVRQVLPAGYLQSSPADNYGDHITVTAGAVVTNQSFTDTPATGSISGTVSGGKAGETVYLDANNNSQLDSGEISTTTGANGSYSFSGVAAGAYIVRQILPAGYQQISPSDGYGIHITLSGGGALSGENFTDQAIAVTGSISGTVTGGFAGETIYLDANNDSKLDDGELSTTTNGVGAYSFPSVPAGAYIIRQVLASGYVQVGPADNYGLHITIAAGAALVNENFVDQAEVGSISGTVSGGVAGETIYLDANNNSRLDNGELSTTTNSSEQFSFSDVPVGAYIIRQVLPSGYAQMSPSDGYGLHITVAAGAALTNENFDDAVIVAGNAPATADAIVMGSSDPWWDWN